MSETDQIQNEPDPTKEPEEPVQGSPGLGATLKAEREKKGLSLDQVASVTNLRWQMIDALENEAWGNLPPPVFVRGFIRTYAKVLDADEKNLIALYERVIPAKTEPLVPLEVPRRSRKGWYLISILVVVLLGIVFSLWQGYPRPLWKTLHRKKQTALESAPKKEQRLKETQPKKEEGGGGAASKQENAPPATPVPSPALNKAELPNAEAGLKDDHGKPQTEEVAKAQNEAVPAPEEKEAAYVLDAVVVETTWVRISIDGGEPKEYLLNPGFKIQWKAKEGFALLVGNAAGIELELNGQKLGKLGNPGQVVRLRLPKGYTPTRSVG
jgi:cytoskeleton protein RodZ